MKVMERRFDVRLISKDALIQYMAYRDMSVRTLAEKVGCSRSTIGHLRTGHMDYIRPAWAKAIERHLQAPPGSLFVAELTTVQRDAPRGKASA